MGVQIEGTRDTTKAADRADLAGFPSRTQILQALEQLETDLTTLGSPITLAVAAPILRRTLQNQRAIIRALAVLVRQQRQG